MGHRVTLQAQTDLDRAWFYIAMQSASIETADRLIEYITDRFSLLAKFSYMGRPRRDLGPEYRSFAVGEYVIVYSPREEDIDILRVVHGRRNTGKLFRS